MGQWVAKDFVAKSYVGTSYVGQFTNGKPDGYGQYFSPIIKKDLGDIDSFINYAGMFKAGIPSG